MIAAAVEGYVPSGRQYAYHHCGPFADDAKCSNDGLADKLKRVSLKEANEWWSLRESPALCNIETTDDMNLGLNCLEDELYVRNHTAFWSRGWGTCNKLLCSYTMTLPIKHALWCTIHYGRSAYDINMPDDSQKAPNKESVDAICLIDEQSLKIFTRNGEDFTVALPFQVVNARSTSFGIVVERAQADDTLLTYGPRATMFSLSHPLDELCPVTFISPVASSSNASYAATPFNPMQLLNNANLTMLYYNEDLKLCITFDKHLKQLMLLRLRKLTATERTDFINFAATFAMPSTPSIGAFIHTPSQLLPQNRTSNQQQHSHSSSLLHFLSTMGQHSWNSGIGGRHSRLGHSSMLARSGSVPLSNASPHPMRTQKLQQPLSNSTSPFVVDDTPLKMRQTPSMWQQNSATSKSFFDSSKAMSFLHAVPQLCLDGLWHADTEAIVSNAFICTDFAHQHYLCYLQPSKLQLTVARALVACENVWQFGVATSLSAKDALFIAHLHLVAVLEHSNNISLYSGLTPVARIHMGGTLIQHAPSPHSANVVLMAATPSPAPSPLTWDQLSMRPQLLMDDDQSQSFPRRSSLLPSLTSRLATDVDFSEHMISPVLPSGDAKRLLMNLGLGEVGSATPNASLDIRSDHLGRETPAKQARPSQTQALTDNVKNRLTLRYNDGSCYRLTLPLLADSLLVVRCLQALKQCLTCDQVLVFFGRWYITRNALGASPSISSQQEWEMFKCLLLELLGYFQEADDDEENDVVESTCSFSDRNPLRHKRSKDSSVLCTPSTVNAKRHKQSEDGSDTDWQFLLKSEFQQKMGAPLSKLLYVNMSTEETPLPKPAKQMKIHSSSILFPQIYNILRTLHLLYEDMKLNNLSISKTLDLAILLNEIAGDLGLIEYSVHYWKDYPMDIIIKEDVPLLSANDLKNINTPFHPNEIPCNVMKFIYNIIRSGCIIDAFPYVQNVNCRTRDVLKVCAIIASEIHNNLDCMRVIYNLRSTAHEGISLDNNLTRPQQATMMLVRDSWTKQLLGTLPISVQLLIDAALWKCRENPPTDWPPEAYDLIQRGDLAIHARSHIQQKEYGLDNMDARDKLKLSTKSQQNQGCMHEPCEDGMEDLNTCNMKLRFSDDQRVLEVRRMLQSAHPVTIALTQRPEVSDHDFIEEQEKHLFAICTRTMALAIGRGMATLRTASPIVTEPMVTPTLCLTGKAPPKGTTVELTHIETPSSMNLWPLFHNGVASGLRITPDASNIDNTWILFNKPKGSVEQQMEHAGFLMALGLNGHLKNLEILSTYDYLVKLHEMTSIGVLLGLAASFRGTEHRALTKVLSIHLEALLPPTSVELDVPQNLQVACLLGIGLLYQSTGNRQIIEVLLSEIGRPPGPEMENSTDRESYALAAGLALGLVTLKQGGHTSSLGLSDLNVADVLNYYMVGGTKRPLVGTQKDKYKVPSFQIREGNSVNLDVTAPGATIALGLMYMGTNSASVADWLKPPHSQYLLDFVRPDMLMLRILSRSLIMWEETTPSTQWVEEQVPPTIRRYCMVRPLDDAPEDIDYEAMNQAYCNIVTGACFALGLKYAGSADDDALSTLLHFCHMFTNLTSRSLAELAGKSTIETCLNMCVLSASLVMAGTGNLDVMRLIRHLRSRVGVTYSSVVTYGSHMAIHMALGFLFLGSGRYTISNTPENIAALICTLYPKFPTHSMDNRYHLQAFRHLYVLAVESRLLIPLDIDTLRHCYANLTIVKLDGTSMKMFAPVILPNLNDLQKVVIDDERYWPITFERGRNWNLLTTILSLVGCVDVKQRAGCLSYITDRLGYRSRLARTLAESMTTPWSSSVSSIMSFTSDEIAKQFCSSFLSTQEHTPCPEEHSQWESICEPHRTECSDNEWRLKSDIARIMYDAVIRDKLVIVPIFMTVLMILQDLKNEFPSHSTPLAHQIWQLKLIFTQIKECPLSTNMFNVDTVLSLEQTLTQILESWLLMQPIFENDLKIYLCEANHSHDYDKLSKLSWRIAAYAVYYSLPFRKMQDLLPENCDLITLMQFLESYASLM